MKKWKLHKETFQPKVRQIICNFVYGVNISFFGNCWDFWFFQIFSRKTWKFDKIINHLRQNQNQIVTGMTFVLMAHIFTLSFIFKDSVKQAKKKQNTHHTVVNTFFASLKI